VKLFIERARAISPGLKEDEATLRSIAEICLRLDGLPLAIELAAARVKHLLPSALEQRLADRLRLLVGGPLDLPARQQSMRDTLQWSYDLLTDDERVLFRRLSIFAGGWSLEAAAVVCLDEQEDALDLMSALVDHSLVTLMPSTEPRYRMLDVIREFGALELARDRAESEALRSRHASYFVALVESAEPHLQGPKQELWAARLENDHDNIRSAVLWCIEAGQAELALRLAGASWRFWRIRGYALEGRNWLESALALDDAAVAPVARNKALWGAAWLAFHRGDYARARSLGLELQSNASQDVEIRNALTILGHIALAQGHSEEAVAGMGRALERCSDQKGSWLFATSVMNLGIANAHAAHLRPARQQLEQALGLYAELGDAYFVARARCYLALVALLEERPSEAHSVAVAALRISVDLDDEWGIAEALEWLGAAAAARGRAGFAGYLVAAASRLREAMTLQQMPFDAAAIERQIATARVTAEWSEQLEAGRNASLEEVLLAVFEEGSHSSPSS
jgi:hypothetical protein